MLRSIICSQEVMYFVFSMTYRICYIEAKLNTHTHYYYNSYPQLLRTDDEYLLLLDSNQSGSNQSSSLQLKFKLLIDIKTFGVKVNVILK